MRSLLLAGIAAGAVFLTTQSYQPVVKGSKFSWDAVTQDIEGNPETIDHYELALTVVDSTPDQSTLKTLNIPPGAGSQVLADGPSFFEGQASGPYRVWVRAVDIAGNHSTWTGPLSIVWDQVAPKPPMILRITVVVTVTQ